MKLFRIFLLVLTLVPASGRALAAPGVILLERKDDKLNIFQLVRTLEGDRTVYSLVKRDKNGRFEWSVVAWESEKSSPGYGFLLTVSQQGKVITRWQLKADEPGIRLGMFLLRNTISVVLNLNEMPVSRGAMVPFREAVALEVAQLEARYHAGIRGVVAFLRVINTDQQATDGKELLEMITRKEPDFRVRCPKISRGMDELGEVMNREGKIYVGVKECINLDNLRIMEGARFSVVEGEEGTLRLVVESGILVTKSIGITFKRSLNFIDVEGHTGQLTFNYGKNKSKVVGIDEILKK